MLVLCAREFKNARSMNFSWPRISGHAARMTSEDRRGRPEQQRGAVSLPAPRTETGSSPGWPGARATQRSRRSRARSRSGRRSKGRPARASGPRPRTRRSPGPSAARAGPRRAGCRRRRAGAAGPRAPRSSTVTTQARMSRTDESVRDRPPAVSPSLSPRHDPCRLPLRAQPAARRAAPSERLERGPDGTERIPSQASIRRDPGAGREGAAATAPQGAGLRHPEAPGHRTCTTTFGSSGTACCSPGPFPRGRRSIPRSSAWRCRSRTTRSSTRSSRGSSRRASTAAARS